MQVDIRLSKDVYNSYVQPKLLTEPKIMSIS